MLPPPVVHETACAKVNLALHVTARLKDGFHALDSLVAFVDIADELTVEPAADDDFHITVDGPFAGDEMLNTRDNLVMQAARLLQRQTGGSSGARFHLRKNIPIGAGLGGGSADAAATLRALNRLWQTDVPDANLQQMAAKIGSDVPVCVSSAPARMQGKGEKLSPLPSLPDGLAVLLVNSGEAVQTGAVYASLEPKFYSGDLPAIPQQSNDWLAAANAAGNDLQKAACQQSGAISGLLEALQKQEGNRLARMSGSGGTCFAVFDNAADAQAAQAAIQRRFPAYWAQTCQFKAKAVTV